MTKEELPKEYDWGSKKCKGLGELPTHKNPLPPFIQTKADNKVEPYKIVNVIIIPDNATNGEMIKTMFPNAKEWEVTEHEAVAGHYVDFGEGSIKVFTLKWWNAPYKAKREE